MTRRPGDDTPEPPGGRAAERLREFLEQRGLTPDKNDAGTPADAPEPDDDAIDAGGADAGDREP